MLEGATPQERCRARELLARAEGMLAARPPRPSPFPHVEAALGRALLGQALGERWMPSQRCTMEGAMLSLFVSTIVVPEGIWRARFELEPGCCYSLSDVQVEAGDHRVAAVHTLTVTATQPPSETEFGSWPLAL